MLRTRSQLSPTVITMTPTAANNTTRDRSRKRRAGQGTGRPGGRATKNGRIVQTICGIEHRLYRKPDPTNPARFVRAEIDSEGRVPDTLVYRFGREVGFSNSMTDKEKEDVSSNRIFQQARDEANQLVFNPNSTTHRGTSQSYFECYVIKVLSETEYGKFLLRLRDALKDAASVAQAKELNNELMLMPHATLIFTYMQHLRRDVADPISGEPGRCNKAGTIETHIKCLSGVTKEFGIGLIHRTTLITNLLHSYFEEDESSRAASFDMAETLPKLWKTLWKDTNWNFEQKLSTWTRLLVQIALIARASDVCGKYCPLMEHVELPNTPSGWGKDGLPIYIQISFLNWKGRPRNMVNTRYRIRIYANKINAKYCPVHWLMYCWSRNSLRKQPGAQIIPKRCSEKTYQKHIKELFQKIPKSPGASPIVCSSHSVRRSAAQFASRCGVDCMRIRDIGRWVSFANMAIYVAEGQNASKRIRRDNGGIDPIYKIWIFNEEAAVDSVNSRRGDLAYANV
jgi:hypothetical protein